MPKHKWLNKPPVSSKTHVLSKATIVDFDKTLSYKHTFENYKRDKFLGAEDIDIYNCGQEHATSNLKKNVKSIFKHGSDDLCAVATFHNNPLFVAGYISVILGKKLTINSEMGGYPPNTNSPAIAVFSVEGEDESRPVLISYLDAVGDNFETLMNGLKNKNRQIEDLRATWLNLGLIDKHSEINFYDDSSDNYEGAKSLDYVNSHQVAEGSIFSIKSSSLITDRFPMRNTHGADVFVPQLQPSQLTETEAYEASLLGLKSLNNPLCEDLINYIKSAKTNNSIPIVELTSSLQATKKRLEGTMTEEAYLALAQKMQGSSSSSLKRLGVAMIGVALGLLVLGIIIAPFLLSALPAAPLVMSLAAIGVCSSVSAVKGYGFFVKGSQHGLSLKMTELNQCAISPVAFSTEG
jgi:hypothetical protein